MVLGIDWERAKCVVELGAGTGPITKELVKAAGPTTRLVIVERDPDFCRVLRAKFPGQDVVEGDACRLDEILAARGIAQADHVISGLPLPSFPPAVRDSIIHMSARVLGPGRGVPADHQHAVGVPEALPDVLPRRVVQTGPAQPAAGRGVLLQGLPAGSGVI
jgi:phospholipid N-methyltransferase